MPDLRKAALAEEQKLAVKYLKPAPAVVETFALKLANSGLPMHAASVIAMRIAQLEEHCEILNGFCQSLSAIGAGLQDRIAGLESGTPPHQRKVEKR